MKYDLQTFAWRFGLRFQDDGSASDGSASPGPADSPGGTSSQGSYGYGNFGYGNVGEAPGGTSANQGTPAGTSNVGTGGFFGGASTDGTSPTGGFSVSSDTAPGGGDVSGFAVRGVNAPTNAAAASPGSQAALGQAATMGLGTGGGLGGQGGVGASPGLTHAGAGFANTGDYGQAFGQQGVKANFGRGGSGSTGALANAANIAVPNFPGIRASLSPALSQLALQLFQHLFAPTLSGFPAGEPGSALGPGTTFGYPAASPTIGGVVGQPSSIRGTPGSNVAPLGLAGPLSGPGFSGGGIGSDAVRGGTAGETADDTGNRGGDTTDTGNRGGTDATPAPNVNPYAFDPNVVNDPNLVPSAQQQVQDFQDAVDASQQPVTPMSQTPYGINPSIATKSPFKVDAETIGRGSPFTPQQIQTILNQILGSTQANPTLMQLAMNLAMGV